MVKLVLKGINLPLINQDNTKSFVLGAGKTAQGLVLLRAALTPGLGLLSHDKNSKNL